MRFSVRTHYRMALVLILALTMFGAGCGSDETVNGEVEGSGPIKVDGIIFNPKSIAPGDTVQLTAIVTGSSAPGDFVSFKWRVLAGTAAVHDSFFLDSDRTSVRWIAPPTSRVYQIQVDASNSVSTSSMSRNLFVVGLTPFIAAQAGQLRLTPSGDAYFLSTPVRPGLFNYKGLHVRFKVAGGSNSAVTTDPRGVGSFFNFTKDLKFYTHTTFPSSTPGQANQELGNIAAGTVTTVAQDGGSPLRPDVFFVGSFSPNDSFLTYSAQLTDNVNFPPVNVDSFVVFTRNIYTSSRYQATFKPTHANCFYPTFSSCGNWLVYLSDRAGVLQWEYDAIPVTGGVPDTSPGAIQKWTNTGGQMGTANAFPGIRFREWNRNATFPTLAAIDAAGGVWLVSPGAATKAGVAGNIRGFAWSASGQRLVVHTTSKLTVMSRTGALQMSYDAVAGDVVSLPSWSPDNNFIIYNVQRQSNSWWEIWDVGGVTGLIGPIQVTGATSAGSVADYATVQDLRPVWRAGTLRVYLPFFDGPSPTVSFLSAAGLLTP